MCYKDSWPVPTLTCETLKKQGAVITNLRFGFLLSNIVHPGHKKISLAPQTQSIGVNTPDILASPLLAAK
jgi:hypothetical protein